MDIRHLPQQLYYRIELIGVRLHPETGHERLSHIHIHANADLQDALGMGVRAIHDAKGFGGIVDIDDASLQEKVLHQGTLRRAVIQNLAVGISHLPGDGQFHVGDHFCQTAQFPDDAADARRVIGLIRIRNPILGVMGPKRALQPLKVGRQPPLVKHIQRATVLPRQLFNERFFYHLFYLRQMQK